ncbi:MAG: DUF1329 domain-containing protein, partial [Spirochaetes bacterium]|nr:DUF1329 domain-containing protein [Spirochaetota bacterium]
KGIDHEYSKRVEYCDEDSWYFIRGDRYDMRGNIWRINEWYIYFDPCQVYRAVAGIINLNLESGRYELSGGSKTKSTRESMINPKINPNEFNVHALTRGGR